jgi:uncharacterized protein YacL
VSVDFYFRLAGMVVCGALGWIFGARIGDAPVGADYLRGVLALTLLGAALGLLLAPYVTTVPFRRVRRLLRELPAEDLFAGTIGFTIGLLISALLALPLSSLPEPFNKILPFVFALVLAYTGAAVMVMRERELFGLIFRVRRGGEGVSEPVEHSIVLDTSSIIDGRIAEIIETGFLQGTLVVPQFVLNELRHIADSTDALRRSRGRHGLEVLDRLKKRGVLPVNISEVDFEDIREVDAKLVKLARQLRAPIVTTDFNLNRVAGIQGVRVLNVNELTNAVKASVLPGEEIAVQLIQEGKEFGQGVGYLDDGTMVVVDGGRRHINDEIDIIVTRVHQTAAGRMIFGHPKSAA